MPAPNVFTDFTALPGYLLASATHQRADILAVTVDVCKFPSSAGVDVTDYQGAQYW
jgi:hypothetical protein